MELESLESCISDAEAELAQCQAALSHARHLAQQLQHDVTASCFEENVRKFLNSERWAARRRESAAARNQIAVATTVSEPTEEVKTQAAQEAEVNDKALLFARQHTAALRIQLHYRLARRRHARRLARTRAHQARLRLRASTNYAIDALPLSTR